MDTTSFEALVRPHVVILLRYAFSIVRNKETAEDVVQDVLCWMWDNREKLEIQTSVKSYLLSAVHHRAINAVKKTRTEERRGLQEESDDYLSAISTPHPNQQEVIEHKDMEAALLHAISNLPERRREIMLLRHQGLSYPEIAEVLRISVKTVEAQVRLGFITLREVLGPWSPN